MARNEKLYGGITWDTAASDLMGEWDYLDGETMCDIQYTLLKLRSRLMENAQTGDEKDEVLAVAWAIALVTNHKVKTR